MHVNVGNYVADSNYPPDPAEDRSVQLTCPMCDDWIGDQYSGTAQVLAESKNWKEHEGQYYCPDCYELLKGEEVEA